MIKNLERARTGAGFIAWYTICFACAACILTLISGNTGDLFTALVLSIPFAGTMALSRQAKNAAIYVGYHILILAILWGLNQIGLFYETWRPWVLSGLILGVMIVFFAKRMYTKGPYFNIHPAAGAVFFILWLAANGMDAKTTCMVMTLCACIFFLCAVAVIYLTNILAYISDSRETANMPVKAIIRSGNGSMTAFLALGIILMAVFTHMGLENFLEGAKNLLLTGIRFLFSLLPQEEEAELIPEPAPESSGSSGMPPLGEGETSQIMMAISNFLVAFMKIVIFLAAIALVVYIIYQLWNRFLGAGIKKGSAVSDASIPGDVVEKLTPTSSRKLSRIFSSSLPKNRIRRIYFKKISGRHKKAAIDPAMTPWQLTGAIRPSDPEAARKFTEIYEKVRYSKTPEEEDISAYKELSKKV